MILHCRSFACALFQPNDVSSFGRISENVVLYVVRRRARRLELDHLAPHDLRRTCAKLLNGGELEQIQFLLGHASVLTT